MALQVWLPLNGNLNNQGLTDITVTNSGTTVDNNGKIGKCYAFNGSSKITNTLPTSIDSNIGTLACWFKMTSLPSSSGFYNLMQLGNLGGYATCRFGVYMEYSNRINISIDGSGTNTNAYAYSMVANQWYHLCVTYDGTTVKLYIDGVEVLSKVSTKGSYKTTASYLYVGGTSSYYLKGGMNDVRYYDHALSPKEVEVLSRGLVCHYPLSGGGRGGDNLLKNTADLTLWAKEGGITTTWDSEKNMYKIEDSTHTNSRWGIYQDINVEANTSYTITVTLDGTACGAGFAVYDGSTSFPPAVISTTGRQSYTLTSGANSTKARVYLYTNCGVGEVAWFSLPKVEKSDHTTPWMPNPADTEYTKMGYDSTTEYDVSGYGYNGTKNGTITYNSDTARYSVSTVFNGTNTYIESDPLPSETKTVSVWLKTTWAYPPSGYRIAMHDKNTGLAIGWTTSTLIANCGTSNGSTCAPTGKYIANQWNHVVVVKTGTTTRDIYINGEKMTTAVNNYWAGDQNTLNIGNRHYSGSYSAYWDGQISDFRAYATALSAEQIAELYNTAVSVANNGTLMGYELVEV